jgi:hypothetical protein
MAGELGTDLIKTDFLDQESDTAEAISTSLIPVSKARPNSRINSNESGPWEAAQQRANAEPETVGSYASRWPPATARISQGRLASCRRKIAEPDSSARSA